jgi:dihydrofolate reductase
MRKIVVSTYASVDGFVDNPHLWSLPYWCDEAAAYAKDLLFAAGALLLGRVTYEGFAQAWPSMTDEGGFAERMNTLPKYVVSSALQGGGWGDTTVLGGDVAEQVGKLKEEPGQDILSYGCGGLAATLLAAGLLDELHLWVHPVVVGSGQSLFPAGTAAGLDLAGTTTFPTGIVVLSYRPAAVRRDG